MFLSAGSTFRTLEVCTNPIARRSVLPSGAQSAVTHVAMTLSLPFSISATCSQALLYRGTAIQYSNDTVHLTIPLSTTSQRHTILDLAHVWW